MKAFLRASALAALLLATTAQAEPTYPANFFTSFQPQTALDMLTHTPGFTLLEGDYVRGFGGAAGNVLIDGQRPTVKAGGIIEFLRRIPATRVAEITLIRGGEAAEAQGQILVANVILKSDAESAGTATFSLTHMFDGTLSPAARISHAQKLGPWDTGIELSGEITHFPTTGRIREYDASGTLLESRREHISGRSPELGLGFSASRALAGGTFTLNARLGYDSYSARQTFTLQSSSARETLAYIDTEYSAELGADWSRAFGDWTAKLVALTRLDHYRADEDFTAPDHRGVSALRQRPAETIGRITLSRESTHWLKPEFGAELAWNGLTSDLDYAEDTGTGLTPIALSGANTRVTELRGEIFANATLRLSTAFSAETGLGFERSRIRATSDATHSQTLSYLKPSAALIWSAGRNTELRFGFRRTVNQLDFGDFAASVDQADNRPLGGNAELRPARLTRAYLRADHRWGEGGALSAELFHQNHDGLLGYILLPSGDQGVGAIGNGQEWGLTAQATIPLATILEGAQVKLDATLRRSQVREYLTGRTRRIDDLPGSLITAEFRHDLPQIKSAWGLRYAAAKSARIYFIGEEYLWQDDPVWTIYLETSAIAGFKSILTIEALTGHDKSRLRRFSTGTESRMRREGTMITLSLARALR